MVAALLSCVLYFPGTLVGFTVVASLWTDDDFSFAYVVGERQGGETVDCGSWTEQRGMASQPSQPSFTRPIPTYDLDGGRSRDALLGEEGCSIPKKAQPEQPGGRDAAAAWVPPGAGIVFDSAKGEEDAEAPGGQEDADTERVSLSVHGEGQALLKATAPKATVAKATVPRATATKSKQEEESLAVAEAQAEAEARPLGDPVGGSRQTKSHLHHESQHGSMTCLNIT